MDAFTYLTMCLDAAEQRRAVGPLDGSIAAFSILRRSAIGAITLDARTCSIAPHDHPAYTRYLGLLEEDARPAPLRQLDRDQLLELEDGS